MRLTDEQIAQAKTRIDIYGRATKLKRSGGWETGKCPLHEDSKPSFAVRDGRWTCFSGCGGGDPIEFLRKWHRLSFADAVIELCRDAPLTSAKAPTPLVATCHTDAGRDASVQTILRECGPITPTTAAHLYLWSRNLPTRQPYLLAHQGLMCVEKHRPLPALVAPITNSAGEVTALQRIWCSTSYVPDDAQDSRADLDTRRKSLGSMGRGAVQLGPPGELLGISEGVEKSIAAAAMFGVTVWASCGAHRIARLDIPSVVRKLLIFADNDDTGRAAAAEAQEAYRSRAVVPMFPDPRFKDWEDQYRAEAR